MRIGRVGVVVIACWLASGGAVAQETPAPALTPELIVKLKPAAHEAVQADLARPGKTSPLGPLTPAFPELTRRPRKTASPFAQVYRLSVPDSTTLWAELARLETDDRVEYVQFNYRYRVSSDLGSEAYELGIGKYELGLDKTVRQTIHPPPATRYSPRVSNARHLPRVSEPDAYRDSLGHLDIIRAPEAWARSRGAGVRIGILDTGVYAEHPDFEGQFWVNPGEDLNGNGVVDASDFDGVDSDGNGYVDDVSGYDFVDWNQPVLQGDYRERDPDPQPDDFEGRPGAGGHGTLVAGIALAAEGNGVGVAGVAPEAKLVDLRAFGAVGIAEDDDTAAALVYAADMGIEVVNMSFGDAYYSPLMREAVQYAAARGVVLVASGGNDGTINAHYPSDYPEVIAAAWLTADGESPGSLASHGVGMDLGAPGSFIYTTLQPRPEQLAETTQPDTLLYGRRSGSSTSAPQVAAAAAMLKSTDPTLSPEGVRSILTATAVDLDTFSRRFVGSGRLDVAAALQVPFAGRVQLVSPDRDGGVSSDDVEVVGSVVSPLLQSYQVFVGLGDEESEQDDYEWTPLGEAGTAQVRDGVLAVWDTRGRPDSVHVLRLVATLTNGQEIEDRRRVYLDRTAPEPNVQRLDLALYQGQYAIQADVASDDFANVTLEVRQNGQVTQIATDRQARRHGARWVDQAGFGGMTEARLVLTNVAGLTTTTDWTVIDVPARADSPNRFDVTTLDVPAGYLMPETVDFDDDGLREIVFNRFEGGSPGDSLLFYEWAGDAFEPLALIEANLIPRDAGDTDGDGRPELLMQASAFTFMLEFDPSSGFSLMHDYTPESPERDTLISSVWGARLADLDGDGKGELIAHNLRDWYVLEFDGTRHSVVAQLDNPTDPLEAVDSQLGGTDPNRPAAQLRTLVGDFDDDGRQDLIVTDIDGDVIVYEAKGDDTYEAVWSATSGLYGNSESRLGMGDFDGDGRLEFVSYATTFRSKRLDNEYEPAYGVMSHWRNTGDDQFERVSELVLSNIVANQGTLAAIDTDGDGADELIVSHAPDLYVLRWTPAGWVIDYHDGYTTPAGRPNDVSAPVSINVAVTDFDRSGRAEFIASNADGQMRRYVPAEGAVLPVAGWAEAFALDAETVHLTWRAPDADSVVVWRAEPGTDFDPVASGQDSLIYVTNAPARYRLQAWYTGEAAPLSEARFVRPHAPAVVTDVEYAPDAVRVTFSEPLDPATQPGQILIDGVAALDALLLGDAGRTLILGLDPMPVGAVSVNWINLRDAEGTPVGQANIALDIPSFAQPTLVLVSWTALDARTAELTFSDALAPETAEDPSNYRVEPLGTVVSAQRLSDRPETVRLEVNGQALGATGLQTTIIVERMRSVAGTSLSPEGRVATLSGFAETLDDVYIFPNPFEAVRHESRVVIAGLPREASIRIFSPAGVLVNTLDERDGDGGAPWDLRDTSGQAVPSGIYLVHIESGDLDPVIVKAVIVR